MDRPPQNPPPPGTRLMDQLREQLRYAHYSLRTEAAYLHWVRASAPTTGATPVSWRSLLDNLAGAAPLAPPPPVQPPPLCYLAAARTTARTTVRTVREPLPCLAAFRPTPNWSAAATTAS